MSEQWFFTNQTSVEDVVESMEEKKTKGDLKFLQEFFRDENHERKEHTIAPDE